MHNAARRMFDEQIGWAVDAGVDFIIGETYSYSAEAELAAQAIREAGLPAAVTWRFTGTDTARRYLSFPW